MSYPPSKYEFLREVTIFRELYRSFTWDDKSLLKIRLGRAKRYLEGWTFDYPDPDLWNNQDLLNWLYREGYCPKPFKLERELIVKLVKKIIALYCSNLPVTHLIRESGISLSEWFRREGYFLPPDTETEDLSQYILTIQSGRIPWDLFRVPEETWNDGTTNILVTIPGDIIRVILRDLNIHDLFCFSQTSQDFSKLCQDRRIWAEHMRDCSIEQIQEALRLNYLPSTEVTLECLDRLDFEQLSKLLHGLLTEIEDWPSNVEPSRSFIKLPLLIIRKIASLNRKVELADYDISPYYLNDYMKIYKPEDTDELFRGLISISESPGDFLGEIVARLWCRGDRSEISYWLDSAAETPELLELALAGLLTILTDELGETSDKNLSKLFIALWKRYAKNLTLKQRNYVRSFDPIQRGDRSFRDRYLDTILENDSP